MILINLQDPNKDLDKLAVEKHYESKKKRLADRYQNDPEYRKHKHQYGKEWKRNRRQIDPNYVDELRRKARAKYAEVKQDPAKYLEHRNRQRSIAGVKNPEVVTELLILQKNLCAICGEVGPNQLDHCHESGLARMMLCRSCNVGIGHLRDSPELLRAAADAIENPPANRLKALSDA